MKKRGKKRNTERDYCVPHCFLGFMEEFSMASMMQSENLILFCLLNMFQKTKGSSLWHLQEDQGTEISGFLTLMKFLLKKTEKMQTKVGRK